MATSAFKSTTKRSPVGTSSSSSSSSSEHSGRRSRSLSRFSRPITPEYIKNAPRGKFVNTTRGSTTPFQEISLDDLALELFSPTNDNHEREGRSICRRGEIGRWGNDTDSSRRKARSVSRTRGDVVSSSSPSVSRRPRSLSVARCKIIDSETSHSHSSHSSALTDDESKDSQSGKNGFEKIIRAVYAQKAEHPNEDTTNGRLYEEMRKELRYAVEEIRTELNQKMATNQTTLNTGECMQPENSEALLDTLMIREKYAPKLEQRSSNVSRVSERLNEEAERYFEDFICNVEDTDISSFDDERSDGSSTHKTPVGPTSRTVEVDDVIFPWLQWETSHDGSLSGKNKAHTPVTPKALQWDSDKEMIPLHYPSSNSISSRGSWSPGLVNSCPTDKKEETCKTRQVDNDCISWFDMDEYLKLRNNEEVLSEIYRERNRISSGRLLICTNILY